MPTFSTIPLAKSRCFSMLNSWYLMEELPQFKTRIFIVVDLGK
jgi:hypothetical protein